MYVHPTKILMPDTLIHHLEQILLKSEEVPNDQYLSLIADFHKFEVSQIRCWFESQIALKLNYQTQVLCSKYQSKSKIRARQIKQFEPITTVCLYNVAD